MVVSGALAGACIGSFLATVARRWDRGTSAALGGRSACDQCGSKLGAIELIPVFGRMACRGLCRHCGARIPIDETWIELSAALVGGAAFLAAPPAWPWLLLCGWLLVLLASIDHFHGILPDMLNGALFVGGLLSLWFDPSAPGVADGLLGSAVGLLAFGIIAKAYGMIRGESGLGGGDIKLMGAMGVWVGLLALSWVVLLAASAALVAALIHSRGRFEARRAIHFGPWLAGAGFIVAMAVRT